MATTRVLKAGPVLTLRFLGALVEAVERAKPGTTVDVDLDGCSAARPFTEGKLVQACASAFQRRVSICFHVGRADPPAITATVQDTFGWLCRSAAGFAVAFSDSRVMDRGGNSLLQKLRDQHLSAAARSAGVSHDPQIATAWAASADHASLAPETSVLLDVPADASTTEFQTFARMLGTLIQSVAADAFERSRLSVWLNRFVFECVQNTVKHTQYGLDGRPLIGCRLLLVRRLPSDLWSDSSVAIRAYLEGLGQLFDSSGATRELYEITIADSGEGIPGRFSKQANVYSTVNEEQELSLVQQAMALRRTTGAQDRQGAGAGLYSALHAVSNTAGLFHVTTGRIRACRHYLLGESAFPDMMLRPASPGMSTLSRGTAITFIVPALGRG